MADRVIEELDEAESLRLIAAGGIGRIAYQSRFGPAGERELFLRIVPNRVTGRRIKPA